jgi:hypothetical protein
MSKIVIVTYKTKPGAADENERLVKGVYAQLAAEAPGEFHYATFRLGDGVSFLHLGIVDGEVSPLSKLSAFQEFQRGIPERCVEPPMVLESTVVGSYRLLETIAPPTTATKRRHTARLGGQDHDVEI